MIDGNQWGCNYSFQGEYELRKCIKETMKGEFNRDKIQAETELIFGEDYAYRKWKKVIAFK